MVHLKRVLTVMTLFSVAFAWAGQPTSASASALTVPSAPPTQSIRNLNLTLPIGNIELLDANLQVLPGADNKLERFRGTTRVKLPTTGPLADLKMSDLVRADIGLDTGAALSYLGAPLDKDRRYLFLDFGGGLNLSRDVTDDDGRPQELSLSVPPGQRVALVVDPEAPLLFVLGNFNVSYTGDLAMLGNLLQAQGLNLTPLQGVQLPILSTIAISGTLSPNSDSSFVEVLANTGLDAGMVGAALGVQAAPLMFRGGARLDADGLTVTGVTQSAVAPTLGWDGKALVQFRVPFDGQQAFVDLTGALSVPLAQLQTTGTERVTIDGQAVAEAIQDAASNAAAAAVAAAGSAAGAGSAVISGAVSGAKSAVSSAPATASAVVSAAVQAGGGVVSGAKDVVGQAATGVPATVGAGWQSVMQQVCQATRRC